MPAEHVSNLKNASLKEKKSLKTFWVYVCMHGHVFCSLCVSPSFPFFYSTCQYAVMRYFMYGGMRAVTTL